MSLKKFLFHEIGMFPSLIFNCVGGGRTTYRSRYREGHKIVFNGHKTYKKHVSICRKCQELKIGYRNLNINSGKLVLGLIENNTTPVWKKELCNRNHVKDEFLIKNIDDNKKYSLQIEELGAITGSIEIYTIAEVNFSRTGAKKGKWVDNSQDMDDDGKPPKIQK